MVNDIVIIVVSLLFATFFLVMEVTFTTFNRFKLEAHRKKSRFLCRIMCYFFDNPGKYIITILIGKYIALVAYSLYMIELFKEVANYYGWGIIGASLFVDLLFIIIIFIFTAKLLSRIIVRFNPNLYLHIFYIPIFIIYVLLCPIVQLIQWLSSVPLWVTGFHGKQELNLRSFDREDLENLLDKVADGNIHAEQESEIKLLQNVFDFSDLRVKDCMIQRVDMEAVDVNTTIPDLLLRFVETQYTRIFVFEQSIDNIIGYVNTKSLFTNPKSILDGLMTVDFVPESMPAQKLLSNLIKTNSSIAVVADEFGGTAGMISMEDVLEEIFGDIEDEYDSKDGVEKQISDNEYIFSCRLEIDYINEKYGLDIPESEDYDTLAGYIILNNEGIPTKGEELVINDKKIRILRTSSSKLELVQVNIM